MISQDLSFTQAYFEAVSGWTTTGLSVMDVESTPHIFLIYRSIMQFFGGVGIVLVMISALSSTFGMRLYNSEGHSDRILPNLIKSSRVHCCALIELFNCAFSSSCKASSLSLNKVWKLL